MNVLCSAEPCPLVLDAACVFYEGETILFTGINTNDNLETVVQKLSLKIEECCTGGGGQTITLTTVGNSGPATLVGDVLNIPVYEGFGTAVEVLGAGTNSTVRCGVNNQALGDCSAILGGQCNTSGLAGWSSGIVAGCCNLTGYTNQFIGAGACNCTSPGATNAVIGGGCCNCSGSAFGANTFIGAGLCNKALFVSGAVVAGTCNISCSGNSFIGGGLRNTTTGASSGIVAGCQNTVSQPSSSVISGTQNTVTGACSTIENGCLNVLSGAYGTVGNGFNNTISGKHGTISNGYQNVICTASCYGFIGNGQVNITRAGYNNAVVSGFLNTTSGDYATVVNGKCNATCATYGFIGGGCDNKVNCIGGVIAGGSGNTNDAEYGFIGGGGGNRTCGLNSIVVGGSGNCAIGDYNIVGGGLCNTVSGNYSGAVGCCLNATCPRTFYTNNSCACGSFYTSAIASGCAVCASTGGQLIGFTPSALGRRYGSFFDTTDQTAAVINTAYAMKYNNTDLSSGVTVANNGAGNPTRLTVDTTGIYNLQFSAQIQKTSGGGSETITIWIRKNNITDITNSATQLTLANNGNLVVAAWNWFVSMTAGEYVEIMWSATATTIQLETLPAVAPHPAIPSVIVTMDQV